MKQKKRNTVIGLSLLVFAISSCEMTDSQRTLMEGSGMGALVGSAAGALIAGNGDRKKGALIGVAAGALVGGAYGESVNRKKAGYAANERDLQANIAMSERARADAEALTAKNETAIAALTTQLDALKGKVALSESEKASLQSERSALAGRIESSRSQLAKLNEEIDTQTMIAKNESGAQNGNLLAALRREKSKLGAQIAQCETQQARIGQFLP